jgi:hypothetical protein
LAEPRIVAGDEHSLRFGPVAEVLKMQFSDNFMRLFSQYLRQLAFQVRGEAEQSHSRHWNLLVLELVNFSAGSYGRSAQTAAFKTNRKINRCPINIPYQSGSLHQGEVEPFMEAYFAAQKINLDTSLPVCYTDRSPF